MPTKLTDDSDKATGADFKPAPYSQADSDGIDAYYEGKRREAERLRAEIKKTEERLFRSRFYRRTFLRNKLTALRRELEEAEDMGD